MLSLHVIFFLALGIFLPSSTLANYLDREMNFAWRWTPANNPNDAPNNKYDGFGSATYSRTGGCQNGVAHGGNFKLTASRTTDWVDPAYREKLKLVAQGTGNGKCDAQVKGTYDIRQNGPNGRKMILNFPEICVDNDCTQGLPHLQCISGPAGKIIMYNNKFIDECFTITK